MGDLSFGFLVQRAGTAGLGHSLLALFLVRLLDATIVLVIFAATLAFNSTLYKGDLRLSILVTVAIAVLGIASIMSFGVMLRLALRILRRAAGAHWARHRPRTQQLLRRLVDALETHSQFDRALVLKLAALTTLNWLCNFSIVYTVMRTFSVDVSFAQAVLGGTACTVVGFLPVASIGSFGVMEAGWALGFVLVGLPSSLAVASGFAYSLVTFGYAIVLAGVAWIAFGRLAAATRVPKSDDPHPT